METTDIFEKLKSLQVILARKYELEAKIDEAPKQLGTQDEFLAKLKKDFIAKNEEYEAVKEKVLQLKNELDEVVKTREENEKSMDSITSNREFEALEKQIDELKNREDSVRKELQKEEKNLADLNDLIKSTETMINSQESDLNTSKGALDEQIAAYKEELESLSAQENELKPDLDQEILFKFERIIRRNTDGIVAVKNGVCTGCHMILPAQFANEVHDGNSTLFCPYCSRILFYEEAEDDSQEIYFNDAGSLSDDDDLFEDEDGEEDEDDDDDLNESDELSSDSFDDESDNVDDDLSDEEDDSESDSDN